LLEHEQGTDVDDPPAAIAMPVESRSTYMVIPASVVAAGRVLHLRHTARRDARRARGPRGASRGQL